MSDHIDRSRKVAEALEELVAKQERDFQFAMDVLKLPASVRVPMWQALCRRAMAKIIECEREGI